MISVFVKRPATTVMFVLLFALLGLVAFFEVNIERQPRIELPLVTVNVTYPGASPEEIESQVLTKIEDAVVEISELDRVQGRAFENFGYVLLEFKLSADVNVKLIEIKDKVESILQTLPSQVERPVVQKLDPFATSVVDLVLYSDRHNTLELYEFADKKLKSSFSKIPGVGTVDLFGGQKRQIKVDLLPDLMRQKFIGIDEVINQFRAKNLTVPAGNIKQGNTAIAVRFEGEFKSIKDIENLRLTTGEGAQFPLSDIAMVYDGAEEESSIARHQGRPVVTLAVKKISDANAVRVSENIRSILPELIENLPEGMTLELALDQSEFILQETNNTIVSIVLGLVMTTLILLFFTGNWRTTVIAGVVIPSSIVSAMFFVEMSGFTINFITLLAIATSLGTLIANSIVVIESVLTQLDKGKDSITAAIEGTRAAFVPVLAASGTNLVVFTPIAFMGGIVGQFMLQFGMTVVYTTIFSMLASFTLTPMMCGALLSPNVKTDRQNFLIKISNAITLWLLKEYKIIFDALFKAPIVSVLVLVAIFIGSFTVIPYIGNEFVPVSDEDKITVKVTMPQGSRVGKTLITVEKIEEKLRQIPEVKNILSIVGENGSENARVSAELSKASERQRSDVAIIDSLTTYLAALPDAEIEVIRGSSSGGGNADISMNIHGENYEEMVRLSHQALEIFQESGYFRSVTSSHKEPKMELKFYPDQLRLERYGVANAKIASVIRTAVYGDDSIKYKEDREEYDIVITVDDRFKNAPQALNELFVVGQVGLVPLAELGRFELEKSVPMILRRDRERVIQINAYLAKSTAGVVQGELEEKLSKVGFPAGYGYQFVGNAEAQEETGKEIAKAFLLAVILTYMLLAAVMNSFVHPFTISISIFTSYAGVFIGLFFLDSSINIASMLGFVMMVGLAVNNAILILEEVQFLLQKDPQLNIKQALWQGTQNKFRAVLMTSIAVVFGVLPQVWSPDLPKASMGIVVAGGMVSSIFFTLFLTPLIYWYFERIRRWTKGDDGGGIFLTDNGSQTSQSNENSIPADPLIEPTSPSAGSVDMLNVAKIQPS